MDLRSFSPNNQGCIFELGRLVDSVDLTRVVFLVDDTTDRSFLESSMQRLWQRMSAESPNQTAISPTVQLLGIAQQTERDIKNLVRLLLRTRAGSFDDLVGAGQKLQSARGTGAFARSTTTA
jgi:hypothetical protein